VLRSAPIHYSSVNLVDPVQGCVIDLRQYVVCMYYATHISLSPQHTDKDRPPFLGGWLKSPHIKEIREYHTSTRNTVGA
jgi:hypothetical protein